MTPGTQPGPDPGTQPGPGEAGTDPEILLEVTGLSVDFPTDDGVVGGARDVSFGLRRGEALGIVGESGCGKSVTALAVMGLLDAGARVSGSVRFGGRELLGSSEKQLSAVRGGKIAMVFQDPMTSLNPVHTVGRQIAEGLLAQHDMSKQRARERSAELLEIVGVPQPRARLASYPHELSGGMRQRVVIAIAMAGEPDVIVADEPTTALDVTVQAQVLETLRTARERTGAALVLISHDLAVVAGQADRVAVMYAGRIVESGAADDVFYQPRMPYTLGLLGSTPRLDRGTGEPLTPIDGAPPSMIAVPPGCPFTPRCPLAQPVCADREPELSPTTSRDHRAACHFSARLDGLAPGDLFTAGSVDPHALAAVSGRRSTAAE